MSTIRIKKVLANGDCALTFYLAKSEHRLAAIHGLCAALRQRPLPNMINVIPGMADITVVFDQVVQNPEPSIEVIERLLQNDWQTCSSQTHEIPVCYHPELAPDLHSVCEQSGMEQEALIKQHYEQEYQVSMLGFLPGFAYLDGAHVSWNIPRKSSPRLKVAAGSVAIAGQQTGIYALESPGGWHVIGRTPVTMIDWGQTQPMLLNPMDKVRFKPIELEAFEALCP